MMTKQERKAEMAAFKKSLTKEKLLASGIPAERHKRLRQALAWGHSLLLRWEREGRVSLPRRYAGAQDKGQS